MSNLNEQILDAWIQLTTVRILSERGEKNITATYLCELTKMQKSQMNRTLTSMEEKGWIERKRSEEDKRQIFVTLNEEQSAFYREQHEHVLKVVEKLIACIGEEKATQALELFTLISKIAEEDNKRDKGREKEISSSASSGR